MFSTRHHRGPFRSVLVSLLAVGILGGTVISPRLASADSVDDKRRQVANIADQLDNFEKQFGAGAIQKYVGLIDGKVEELKRKISSAKTEEEKQAYALLQRFQSNFNTVAFEKSGKAVTSQEMERLKAALGNIQSNNFADDVRNFASLAAEDYYGTIRSFKDKYRITPTQVRQANELVTKFKLPFTPFGQQQSQAAPAANRVGRFEILVEGQ